MRIQIPWEKGREKALELFRRYKYVLLILTAGVVLLALPAGGEKKDTPSAVQTPPVEDFSVASLETRLAETLSRIQGAGDVTVMLTVQGGSRRVLAEDEAVTEEADGSGSSRRTTVVVSGGSGAGEEPVLLQQLYPRFQGAVVVCAGGDNAQVRLKLMEAVSALTGLGTDKIAICKGKG